MYKISIMTYENEVFIMDNKFETEVLAQEFITDLINVVIDNRFAAFLGRKEMSVSINGESIITNDIFSVNIQDIKHFIVSKKIINKL